MNIWQKKDIAHIWHPYTQMKECKKTPPILIEKARGMKLFDSDGNFYYDTISSWWCNIHGHNHPKIKKAIVNQLKNIDHVMFAGFTHKPAIQLAEKILDCTPKNLTKIFYSDNGSTAVEAALKLSFQYWQNINKKDKTKFISLENSYHGDTIGTMSVGGVNLYNKTFSPLFFSSYKIPAPYCYRCSHNNNCNFECMKPLEKLLSEKHSHICGLIIEPLVLAAGGMIIYPKKYLEKIFQLTQKFNIHLILDEVATGFGRTGKMFACDHVKIKPDFMCLSKGITSGTLPLAATLTTDKIYSAFLDNYGSEKTFFHGHTYTANPIACSAAIASFEIFEEENTLERIQEIIPIFKNKLNNFADLDIVGDIRHIGMIGAIELVKDKKTKTSFAPSERIGLKIYYEGLKQNLLLRPLGSIVYFFLPLCITKKELNLILDKTYDIVRKIS